MISKSVKIVLVGMPGAGKSTFGHELAGKLMLRYLDLDTLIEEAEGMKIPDIFEKYGEGYFRQIESDVLQKTLNLDHGFVLATGGGAPCFHDNMQKINNQALSVYLDVSLEEIQNRMLQGAKDKRPMFVDLDTGEIILKLKSLQADREPHYAQSKIRLSTDDIAVDTFVSAFLSFYKEA